MSSDKIKAYNFFNEAESISEYNDIYNSLDFSNEYPANKKRLEIFLQIIEKISPNKILDVGCGNGMPLLAILKKGYDAMGFDKALNMVKEAKKNLSENGFNEDKVFTGDFENFHISENFDCILGMGAFYYSSDPLKTIKSVSDKLPQDGNIIFSLRNKLFDLISLNSYTSKFLKDLYYSKEESPFQDKLNEHYAKIFDDEIKINSIDSKKVLSSVHNPLTVKDDLLLPSGLELQGIYFYHFHAYPPKYEKISPQFFREKSWSMENPLDWKGNFLASAFIVHAKKI